MLHFRSVWSLLFLWRFFVYFQKKILISAPLFASNSHLQRDEGRQQTQWEFGGIFNVFCEMEAFIYELKVAHFCCFSSAALNCFLIIFFILVTVSLSFNQLITLLCCWSSTLLPPSPPSHGAPHAVFFFCKRGSLGPPQGLFWEIAGTPSALPHHHQRRQSLTFKKNKRNNALVRNVWHFPLIICTEAHVKYCCSSIKDPGDPAGTLLLQWTSSPNLEVFVALSRNSL